MTRLLEMIGAPESTIKMIPDVVATCRVCRTWSRRAPDTKLAVRLSVKFNQCGQVDLLFYECASTPLGSDIRQPTDHIVLHVIDECIRWSVAVAIAEKTPDTIIDALMTHWIQVYGPPAIMIWDGERSMIPTEAMQWASRQRLQLIQPNRHKKAWVVERHNDPTRD